MMKVKCAHLRTPKQVDDVLLRKDVDLVFIICQPDLHAQIAVKALGIGKHVLCDRPAGLCQVLSVLPKSARS